MSQMTENFDTLAQAWLENLGSEDGFPNRESSLIAFDKVCEFAEFEPDKALEFIKVAVNFCRDDSRCLGQIAAGPLEDVLLTHGDLVIERIESEARKDSRVVEMLGGMYLTGMNENVRERIELILEREGNET